MLFWYVVCCLRIPKRAKISTKTKNKAKITSTSKFAQKLNVAKNKVQQKEVRKNWSKYSYHNSFLDRCPGRNVIFVRLYLICSFFLRSSSPLLTKIYILFVNNRRKTNVPRTIVLKRSDVLL